MVTGVAMAVVTGVATAAAETAEATVAAEMAEAKAAAARAAMVVMVAATMAAMMEAARAEAARVALAVVAAKAAAGAVAAKAVERQLRRRPRRRPQYGQCLGRARRKNGTAWPPLCGGPCRAQAQRSPAHSTMTRGPIVLSQVARGGAPLGWCVAARGGGRQAHAGRHA